MDRNCLRYVALKIETVRKAEHRSNVMRFHAVRSTRNASFLYTSLFPLHVI